MPCLDPPLGALSEVVAFPLETHPLLRARVTHGACERRDSGQLWWAPQWVLGLVLWWALWQAWWRTAGGHLVGYGGQRGGGSMSPGITLGIRLKANPPKPKGGSCRYSASLRLGCGHVTSPRTGAPPPPTPSPHMASKSRASATDTMAMNLARHQHFSGQCHHRSCMPAALRAPPIATSPAPRPAAPQSPVSRPQTFLW